MKTSDKILFTSLKLFFKYGVRSVSMDDICKKIGISKKTIYAKVENKKDLIYKTVVSFCTQEEKDINEIVKLANNSIEEMLNIGQYVIGFLRDMNPSLVYDLKKYHPQVWKHIDKKHFGFIETTIRRNIEQGQKTGLYRKKLNAEIISKLYMAQSRNIVDDELFPIGKFPKSDLFEEFFTHHLCGICTEKGRTLLTTKIDFK